MRPTLITLTLLIAGLGALAQARPPIETREIPVKDKLLIDSNLFSKTVRQPAMKILDAKIIDANIPSNHISPNLSLNQFMAERFRTQLRISVRVFNEGPGMYQSGRKLLLEEQLPNGDKRQLIQREVGVLTVNTYETFSITIPYTPEQHYFTAHIIPGDWNPKWDSSWCLLPANAVDRTDSYP